MSREGRSPDPRPPRDASYRISCNYASYPYHGGYLPRSSRVRSAPLRRSRSREVSNIDLGFQMLSTCLSHILALLLRGLKNNMEDTPPGRNWRIGGITALVVPFFLCSQSLSRQNPTNGGVATYACHSCPTCFSCFLTHFLPKPFFPRHLQKKARRCWQFSFESSPPCPLHLPTFFFGCCHRFDSARDKFAGNTAGVCQQYRTRSTKC